MLWEELTAPEFAAAVIETKGTCLVPLGVIEKHGDHLPLGTDLIDIRELAVRAAALEPVVVFPPYYFGQINEARHQPGTLAFGWRFLLESLHRICAEIARNGLKKIILLNGHGGNSGLLPFFVQTMLERELDYTVYLLQGIAPPDEAAGLIEKEGGHADEFETSLMLAIRPDLVRMDRVKAEAGAARNRLSHMRNVYTAIWWYADYPDHQAGDPTLASREKGAGLLEIASRHIAGLIRTIKDDDRVRELQKEFITRAERPNL